MVEEIKSFRACNGKVFDCKHEACGEELFQWFVDTGHMTEASARKIVEGLYGDRTSAVNLTALLRDFLATFPGVGAPPPPPPAPKPLESAQ
jgi:hypothetical protein